MRKISMLSIENLFKNFNIPLPEESKEGKPIRIITEIPLPVSKGVDEKNDTH
jgi:hypothetical protein